MAFYDGIFYLASKTQIKVVKINAEFAQDEVDIARDDLEISTIPNESAVKDGS